MISSLLNVLDSLMYTDLNTSEHCRQKQCLPYPAIVFHLPSWHMQPPSIYFQGKPSQMEQMWKL